MGRKFTHAAGASTRRYAPQIPSLARRLAAGFVDVVVLLFLVGPLVVAANGFGSAPLMAFALVILFAYKPLMEGLYSVTLGKIALGIRLTTIDGKELAMHDSMRRNTLYLIPAFGVISVFALVLSGINVLDKTELLSILTWKQQFLFPLSVNGTVWSLVAFAGVWSVVAIYDLTSVVAGEGYRALHDLVGGTICVWEPSLVGAEKTVPVRVDS
jgi:uncharacterized RDD family membrane protein YckC